MHNLIVKISQEFECLEAEKGIQLQMRLLNALVDNACKVHSICKFELDSSSMECDPVHLVAEVVGQLFFVENLSKIHQRILGMIKRLPDSLITHIKEYWIEKFNSIESDRVEISKLRAWESLLPKDFEDVCHICSLQMWKRCISILELIRQDEKILDIYKSDFDLDLCKEAASGLISSYQASEKAEDYDALIIRSCIVVLDLLQVHRLPKASSVVLGVALCKIVSKEQALTGITDIVSGIFGSSSHCLLILSQCSTSESKILAQTLTIGLSENGYSLIECVSNLARENAVVLLRGLFPALYEYMGQESQSQTIQDASGVMVALLLDTCQLMASYQTDIGVVYHCLAAMNYGLEYLLRESKSKGRPYVMISSEHLKLMAGALLPFTDAHDSSISFGSQTALDALLQISKLQRELDHECLSAYLVKEIEHLSFHTKSKYRCITSLITKQANLHTFLQDASSLVHETLVAISKNASISTSASVMLRTIWRKLCFNRAADQNQAMDDFFDEETSVEILYQITEALLSEDIELKRAVECYALPGLASEAPLALEKALKILLSRSDSLKMVRLSSHVS